MRPLSFGLALQVKRQDCACLCMCTNVRLHGKMCPHDSALFVFPRESERSHWLILGWVEYWFSVDLKPALRGSQPLSCPAFTVSTWWRLLNMGWNPSKWKLEIPLPLGCIIASCSVSASAFPVQTLLFPMPSNPGSIHHSVCVFALQLVCAPRDSSKQCGQDICHCGLCILERPNNKGIQTTCQKVAGVLRKVKSGKELKQTEGAAKVTSGVRLAEVAGMLCAKALRCRCVWHTRRPWCLKQRKQGGGRGAKARGEMGARSWGGLWTLVAAWSRWEAHGPHQWSPGLLLFHLLRQLSSDSLPQPQRAQVCLCRLPGRKLMSGEAFAVHSTVY